MINAIGIALSGLAASSQEIDASAANIANLETAGSLTDPSKAPYTPVSVQQTTGAGGSVNTVVVPKTPPFVPAFDPGSPFANSAGEVGFPNIDLAQEAVNIDIAKIAYRADLAVIKTAKQMEDELFHVFDSQA
jgi:flagellar basal-body rod protein FlgC